jgi:hypothetical protein
MTGIIRRRLVAGAGAGAFGLRATGSCRQAGGGALRGLPSAAALPGRHGKAGGHKFLQVVSVLNFAPR